MRMLLTMLGPVIGLVALTFVMTFVLLGARLRHMKATPPRIGRSDPDMCEPCAAKSIRPVKSRRWPCDRDRAWFDKSCR